MTAEATESIDSPSNVVRLKRVAINIVHNPKAVTGLIILIPIVLISVLAPYIAPYDPTQTHMASRYAAPGGKFLLGTDHLGRDLLSRTLIGGRTSIFLGFAATTLALVLGVPIGMVSGYMKGRIDEILMRIMDILMSFPTLLLGLLLLSALPSNIWTTIVAVGVVYAPRISRVVRSETLSVSERDYISAAKVRDESDSYILTFEVFPNVISPIIVEASIRFGFAIMVGTSLSFLGLGTNPPHPDWGYMISQARHHIWNSPWFLLWPGLALGLTIFSINLFADGLREVIDPDA